MLKAEELAPLVGTSVNQLAQWRFHGDGPPFIKFGRRSVRYRWSDVQAWCDANLRTQT
ncbi:DNA-binding protein [Mycobacterium gordonae]|nr:DNA-binding protein [Mycobacterium gordonae]